VKAAREIVAALPAGLGRLEVLADAGHFTWKDAPERYWPLLNGLRGEYRGRVAAAAVVSPYPEGDLWVAAFRDPVGNVVGVWQTGPRS
jgi:hypothetical protein